MGSQVSLSRNSPSSTMLSRILILACLIIAAFSKPWYQGSGLPDCAPGKCPKTAEVSPIKCSSDPVMFSTMDTPCSVPRASPVTRRLLMLDQVTHVELRRVEKDTRNNFVVYNQNVFGS